MARSVFSKRSRTPDDDRSDSKNSENPRYNSHNPPPSTLIKATGLVHEQDETEE